MDKGTKDVYVRPTENWGLYYVIFYIYTHTHFHIYIYIYTHTYTHAHTHATHTHTHIKRVSRLSFGLKVQSVRCRLQTSEFRV